MNTDLDDLSPVARHIAQRYGEHELVLQNDLWRQAIQGYLASVSFVDDCLGHVLTALYNSPYHDNTVIVLWSDHGTHLGEKQHWHKGTLWEESTHTILLMAGTGVPYAGARIDSPVSNLDIYPTLIDLCWLDPRPELQGHSLYPFLLQPNLVSDHAAVSAMKTHNGGIAIHFSVRSRKWCYIAYAGGAKELYDRSVDPNEWNNLAGLSEYSAVIEDLARWIPVNPAPPILPPTSDASTVEYLVYD